MTPELGCRLWGPQKSIFNYCRLQTIFSKEDLLVTRLQIQSGPQDSILQGLCNYYILIPSSYVMANMAFKFGSIV